MMGADPTRERAIFVFFDTLNLRYLPPYGNPRVHAPNTQPAQRAATFDNCYDGSMPCIPARRELHTGRYGIPAPRLGPLEAFDDSMPQLHAVRGVHTHPASNHHQYHREDGSAMHHMGVLPRTGRRSADGGRVNTASAPRPLHDISRKAADG